MKKQFLLLVDFIAGIAGIENTVASGIHCWIRGTDDFALPGEFREVTESLAACARGEAIHGYGAEKKTRCDGGWNPRGFHGGLVTHSAIGPLAVVEGIFRRLIWKSDIGRAIQLGEFEYVIRPCRADLMPLRLWERYQAVWWGRREGQLAARGEKPFGLVEARRVCFGLRKEPIPRLSYFAKGTTSVAPPAGAVARIGGGQSDTIVFVDKFARPVSAFEAAGGWNSHYTREIPIPSKLDWRRLRRLGKSAEDVMFGVHG